MKAPTKKPTGAQRFVQQAEQRVAARRKAFLAACKAGDLAAQVHIVREVARDRIWLTGIDEDNLNAIEALAGRLPEPRTHEVWDAYVHGTAAAFALGIALGQLVHPDVFTMGGVK